MTEKEPETVEEAREYLKTMGPFYASEEIYYSINRMRIMANCILIIAKDSLV